MSKPSLKAPVRLKILLNEIVDKKESPMVNKLKAKLEEKDDEVAKMESLTSFLRGEVDYLYKIEKKNSAEKDSLRNRIFDLETKQYFLKEENTELQKQVIEKEKILKETRKELNKIVNELRKENEILKEKRFDTAMDETIRERVYRDLIRSIREMQI